MWVFPVILAAIGALATPSPSPSPSPSTGPLKVIVTVRSSTICNEFATHVNAAIGSAVNNDLALGGLIATLHRPQTGDDLEDFGLRRKHAVDTLVAYADALTKNWKDGEKEVSLLRETSQKATDPTEKAEMKASADALGGVLWRQRKVARDLDGFVAYLYAEEMRREDPGPWHQTTLGENTPETAPETPYFQNSYWRNQIALPSQAMSLAGDYNAPPDGLLTEEAARGYQQTLPDIAHDEDSAAEHLLSAGNNC